MIIDSDPAQPAKTFSWTRWSESTPFEFLFYNLLYILTLLIAFAFVIACFGLLLLIPYEIVSRVSAIEAAIPATFICGLGFYWMRRRFQRIYGAVEVLFALSLGAFTIAKSGPHTSFLDSLSVQTVLGMGTSIYVVVRGIDNWVKGGASAKK